MVEFECPICEEEFTLKWHLQKHFRRYHRKHKVVKCGMCKMIFIKKKPLRETADEITELIPLVGRKTLLWPHFMT